mmetsp:Transcript_26221/g.66046  ORF Transcript_26221/g.66046 Transcript_26221/m.66046 type:complete len:973 (+) Transcript_26221:4372-7290(+)
MHVHGHQRLELGPVHHAAQIHQARAHEVLHYLHELFVRQRHDGLVLLLRHFHQRVLEVHGPHDLNSQQGDLGNVLLGEVFHRNAVQDVAGLAARQLGFAPHGAHHLRFQSVQPVFDVSHGHLRGHEVHVLGPRPDQREALRHLPPVLGVEGDARDGVEQLFEVLLDLLGVGALRQNFQQRRVGREVEARELVPLALEVGLQRLLALLEPQLQHGEQLLQHVVLAAVHHVAHLRRLAHDPDPVLVDLLELLRLHRHLLRDVAAGEHGLQRRPHLLHLEPALDRVRGVGQRHDHRAQLLLEGNGVPLRVHRVQRHHGLLQNLLHLADAARRHAAGVVAHLPGREVEVHTGPLLGDLGELLLDHQLLVGGLANVRNLVRVLVQLGVNQVLQLERVGLDGQLLPGKIHHLLPVTRLDGRLGELGEQGQHFGEIIDLLLQLQVGGPLAENLRHALAFSREFLSFALHRLNRRRRVGPQVVFPVLDRVQHHHVQIVQLPQILQLPLRFVEFRVLLMRQAEQVLAQKVDLLLPLPNLVLFPEPLQPLDRLLGRDPVHHGPVLFVVRAEVVHVLLVVVHGGDQVLLVLRLLRGQDILARLRVLQQLVPRGAQHGPHVLLVLVDDLRHVRVQNLVHVRDRPELQLDLGLLRAHLRERLHHEAQRVDVPVPHFAVQLFHRLLHHLADGVQLRSRLHVQLFREGHLPGLRQVDQRLRQGVRLQDERGDLCLPGVPRRVLAHADEALHLRLEVRQRRDRVLKQLVLVLDVLPPQRRELLERVDVVVALALRALDAAGQQQHHLQNLLVLRDPVVEGPLRGGALDGRQVGVDDQLHRFRNGDRVPRVDHLRALQHRDGAPVHGRLDVFDRGGEADGEAVQLQVHVEEGRRQGGGGARALLVLLSLLLVAGRRDRDLRADVPFRGEPRLDPAQRPPRRIQQGLVHGPVVVRLHLDDFGFAHAAHVGVDREAHDLDQQVVDGVLDLQ